MIKLDKSITEVDNEVVEKKKVNKFKIREEILIEGYWANIDGRKFSISPAEKGIIFDSVTGEKKFGIRKYGSIIIDGIETGKDYFEDLTFEQIYQLHRAKVIQLTKAQSRELYEWHQTSSRFKTESEY